MITFSKILALSPHPDDAELGAGGTIAKFTEEGEKVYYVTFSSCEKSMPQGLPGDALRVECRNSTKLLGISPDNLILLDYEVRTWGGGGGGGREKLVEFNEKIKPDLVLVPSSSDIHQDHQVVALETIRAFMKTRVNILAYPIIGNCPGFIPNVYFPYL